MASLKLSDNAFGTLGLTITESIDLAAISNSLSQLLGVNYQLDSLDVSAVTRTGLTATGLLVEGLPLSESTLTVGGFANFDPQQTAVNNFRTLRLTETTTQAEGNPDELVYLYMDIQDGLLVSNNTLSFDNQLQTFDFSAIGTGGIALEVSLESIADFDDLEVPFSGYRIIGSDNGDTVYGLNSVELAPEAYTGSNTYLLGAGDDIFRGGVDVARVDGGDGDDDIRLNIELAPGGNEVSGGVGNDYIVGGRFADLLEGGDGDDVIDGYSGDDVLLGGAGNDLLVSTGFGTVIMDGGAGNDTLYAGEGDTTLTGGEGNDRFVLAEFADIWARMDVADPELSEAFVLGASGQMGAFTPLISDFNSGEDLAVFSLLESSVISESTGLQFRSFNEGGFFFEFSELEGTSYRVEDAQGTISWNNAILQLEQSDSLGGTQILNTSVSIDSGQQEVTFTDGAFEVRYHQGSESTLDNMDTFFGLSVAKQGEAGPVNGQDKINLSLLGLSDRDLEGNPTGSVSELLFSLADIETGFSIDPNANGNPTVLEEFFLDEGNELYRPVHVEYSFGPETDFIHDAMVYVDIDGNGSFDSDSDMLFRLGDIQGPAGDVDLVATDLYDAGSGSGIFIFDTAQESFWFNDPVSEPSPIG